MKTSSIDFSFLDTYLSTQENIYFYFINNPNIPLAFIYKANNRLRKYVSDYVNVLQTMYNSLNYYNNIEKDSITDTNVQVQIFLAKGDNSNLKNSLYSYLKSFQNFKSGEGEIADNRVDVLENSYTGLSLLNQLNDLIEELQRNIYVFNPIFDYSFVKESLLNKLSDTVSNNETVKKEQSSVSTLINILSSYSYLTGIETTISSFAPFSKTNITKEKTKAVAESLPFMSTTNTNFKVTIDSNSYTIPFPSSAAQGKKYIRASTGILNIPTKRRLYFKVEAAVLPKGITLLEGIVIPDGVIAVDIPAGVYTAATLMPVINNGFLTLDTLGNPVQFATCSYFSNDTDKFVIYAGTTVAYFECIPSPGQYNHLTGIYKKAVDSCNDLLGISLGSCKDPYQIDYQDLVDCVSYYIPANLIENRVQISSVNTGENAKVLFQPSISTDIGLTNTYATNTILTLASDSELVTINSVVKDETGEHLVTSINPFTYSGGPNKNTYPVELYTDLVNMRSLLKYQFTMQHQEVLRVWGPILNNPTIEQLNEAKQRTKTLLDSYNVILTNLTFAAQESFVLKTANDLITYLEQKGYNRLIDFLNKADFSNFFAAIKENTKLSYNQALAETISNG